METISVRLDKDLIKGLKTIEKRLNAERSEVIRKLLSEAIRNWKAKKVLEDLREHKISLCKAAKECNLSLWEMLDLAKKNNIDWTGYNREDLERDLKVLGS